MRKKVRKNSIKTSLIAIASCLVLLLPFSCHEKPDAIPKNELQIENNEFFVAENSIKMVAENFAKGFGSNTPNSLKTQKTYSLNEFLDEENGEALLYIVNYDEGGFLIIPADNRVYPILAHSEENSFVTVESEIPDGVNIWVHYTKKAIKKVKKENKKQTHEMKLAWDKYLGFANLKVYDPDPCEDQITIVGPLIQTHWDQDCGYNDFFPTDTEVGCSWLPCGRAYTGCAITALAQIMKYHQHPNSYSWSSMPNDQGSSATAALMWDIAESVVIDPTCEGTNTTSTSYVPSLENDFGYSTSATLSNYTSYSYQTIENEIDNNRPVYMRGDDDNDLGGHGWVVDGYKTSYYCETGCTWLQLHINWGWSGSSDGYYGWSFTFNPYFEIYEFNTNLQMITGIKP